jgi:hypothetical protein
MKIQDQVAFGFWTRNHVTGFILKLRQALYTDSIDLLVGPI